MPTNIEEITINGVTIDIKKANNVLRWLVRKEAENVRTKDRTEIQMIEDIQKRIKEEVECC